VLDAIEAAPWADRTVVILTADHGEALGDHGMSWHGSELWESLVRVPLVVYVPGVQPRRVAARRSHIDLAPTMLALMGITAPPGELSGQSLMPEIEGVAGAEADRDVYIDMPIGPFNQTRRALISGPGAGVKLLHFGGAQYQLFDLAVDPQERNDLHRDKDRLAPMQAALAAFRARLTEIEVKPAEQ
jgi:arylsulfatase A-like enzyme